MSTHPCTGCHRRSVVEGAAATAMQHGRHGAGCAGTADGDAVFCGGSPRRCATWLALAPNDFDRNDRLVPHTCDAQRRWRAVKRHVAAACNLKFYALAAGPAQPGTFMFSISSQRQFRPGTYTDSNPSTATATHLPSLAVLHHFILSPVPPPFPPPPPTAEHSPLPPQATTPPPPLYTSAKEPFPTRSMKSTSGIRVAGRSLSCLPMPPAPTPRTTFDALLA